MSDRSEMKLKVNRGLAWIGLASGLVGVLEYLSLLILLNVWIDKQEYGVAVLAIALFPVLDLATDMGLSAAVIQKEESSEDAVSTVFWFNLAMSLALFGALCLGGPLIGRLQGWPVVGDMIIAYGAKIIFQNVYFIPAAMMKRELRFKEFSIIRSAANVVEFVAKIGFAATLPPEDAIWCFVLAPLCRSLVMGIGIQLRQPWYPRLRLDVRRGWEYVTFGFKTSASQILFQVYTNIDYYVVGYYFGTAALGLYRLAYELVLEPVRVISHVIIDIAFPVFARLRARRAHLVEQFIAFTRQNLVVVLPYAALVALLAEEILIVFWSPEWAPAASAARILVAVAVLRSVSYIVPPLLDGMGYPALTLAYTAVASVVLTTAYILFAELLGDRLGYEAVAVAWACGYPFAFGVLAWLALRLLGVSPLLYLRRIAGIPACAAAALVPGLAARFLLADAPVLVRLAVVSTVTVGVLGILLAYLQGISPRTVMRALKDRGGAPNLASGDASSDSPPA